MRIEIFDDSGAAMDEFDVTPQEARDLSDQLPDGWTIQEMEGPNMTDTNWSHKLTAAQAFDIETYFGEDVEYYEQNGNHFVVSFKEGVSEAFGIVLPQDPIRKIQVVDFDYFEPPFDWDLAEQQRGGPFPQDDYRPGAF